MSFFEGNDKNSDLSLRFAARSSAAVFRKILLLQIVDEMSLDMGSSCQAIAHGHDRQF